MWASIGTILTTFLPLLVKLIWYIIEKKDGADQLKADMVRLIDSMNQDKDISIELHDRYNEQIERIREQLRKEGAKDV